MKNIDFHAHILPAADHGSENVQTSLQQLALAKRARIDTVVATPHFYPRMETLGEFLQRREKCARQLAEAMRGKDLPKVLIGAEVQLCPELDRLEGLEQLCIEGTNVLLLELPPNYSLRTFDHVIDSLIYGRKLRVVLAHIDRYSSIHIDFLLEAGCMAQINAEALCHFRTARRCARWLKSDAVVALGSDVHGLDKSYDMLEKARRKLGEQYGQIMSRTAELLK